MQVGWHVKIETTLILNTFPIRQQNNRVSELVTRPERIIQVISAMQFLGLIESAFQ